MVKKRNKSAETQADNSAENVIEFDAAVEDEMANGQEDTVGDPLTKLKAEAGKNLEGWQRTLAEFQNYKRRTEREQKELRQRVGLDILANILPIIDDFERALLNIPEELQNNAWIDGITLVQTKFNKLLDEHDVEIVDPIGEEFDPNHHQAIGTGDSDEFESGQVIETLQKGYHCGNVLLRPAVVRVAK